MTLRQNLKTAIENATYSSVRPILRRYISNYFEFDVCGKENLPNSGAVLVFNHNTYFDGLFNEIALDKKVHFLVQREGVMNILTKPLLWLSGNIPINVDDFILERRVLKRCKEYLEQGEYVGIFSEGPAKNLVVDGRIIPIQHREHFPVASWLALKDEVPLVPIALYMDKKLSNLLWQNDGLQKTRDLVHSYTQINGKPVYHIYIGEPIEPKISCQTSTRKCVDKLTDIVMLELIELNRRAKDRDTM
jgi:1-acyl-sn-glycerol-3-phosphate acyltransferase